MKNSIMKEGGIKADYLEIASKYYFNKLSECKVSQWKDVIALWIPTL